MAISNRKRLVLLLLLVLIAFGLYRYLAKPEVKGPPEMTVPVSVARAIAQDVPHYLQGIGTVQASADVLVTSRVGGTLMDIYFTEGQRVKEGDLLAQRYEIATRAGVHCAPLIHRALGTKERGILRFSFSWFNTEEEIRKAALTVKEIAGEWE